jgi:protein involved in polysaccharide export with SLBB domain
MSSSAKVLLRSVICPMVVASLMIGAQACATNQNVPTTAPAAQASSVNSPAQSSDVAATSDTQRLEDLWQKRTHDGFGSDFTLGPGDVLEISVPLEQLEHREVRVSPQDTIELPLAGVVPVRGMNEQDLTDALRQRLSKYMYDPPVSLFVKHYGSREVAVVGAVEKPGLYTLTSGSDTLMDMVDRAGGMTKDAASKIVFVPAGSGGSGLERASFLGAAQAPDADARAQDTDSQGSESDTLDSPRAPIHRSARSQSERVGSIRPSAAAAGSPRASVNLLGAAAAKLHPITISMADPGVQQYLGMPARPGDVLIVPSAGEVTVGGWVQSPGAYKITPGMTALSAISAAGGALFSSSAEILRTAPDGQRLSIPVDVSKVQAGQQADVPVQSGDVVMVDRSTVGAVPYAMYEIFTKFGTGMYLPIP